MSCWGVISPANPNTPITFWTRTEALNWAIRENGKIVELRMKPGQRLSRQGQPTLEGILTTRIFAPGIGVA